MTEPTVPPNLAPLSRAIRRRRNARMFFLSAAIFVSGAVCGWGITWVFAPPRPMPGEPPPDPPVSQLVDRLREELLLSDDQVRQVRQIYEQRFAALHSVREEMAPKLRTEYDQLRQQIKVVLTPAQFTRWDQRFESVRNRMLPPPNGRPPRGPGGPDVGPGGPGGPDEGPPGGPDDFGGPPGPPPGDRRGPPPRRPPGGPPPQPPTTGPAGH